MTIEISCKIVIEKDELLKALEGYDIIPKKNDDTIYFYGNDNMGIGTPSDHIYFDSDTINFCDSDDESKYCKTSWYSFWDDPKYSVDPKGNVIDINTQYTEEELNAMCDKAALDEEKCREHKNSKHWVLPVEQFAGSDEYLISFPEDLLKAANLKEGDEVEWVDNGDGSFMLKKIEKLTLSYNEAIAQGWTMTGDGFWIKES
jgi:hypothetical protein